MNLVHDKIEKEDYQLGGYSKLPTEVLQENQDWTPYLPKKELQNKGFETSACVTFTTLNCIEILIKRKYGIETNWSDRFLACASGTDKGGNSPKQVAETLRKLGCALEEQYPFEASSYKDFYKLIPPKMYELAKEFFKYSFQHEYVSGKDIDEAIKYSPLLISVSAWHKKNGLFYRPEGYRDNHATTYVKREPDSRKVFDTYDSHLKSIHLDALPQVAKRFHIERKPMQDDAKPMQPKPKTRTLLELLRQYLCKKYNCK